METSNKMNEVVQEVQVLESKVEEMTQKAMYWEHRAKKLEAYMNMVDMLNSIDIEAYADTVTAYKTDVGSTTVINWTDGTKTVAIQRGDPMTEKEVGILVCMAKKAMGNKEFHEEFEVYRKMLNEVSQKKSDTPFWDEAMKTENSTYQQVAVKKSSKKKPEKKTTDKE